MTTVCDLDPVDRRRARGAPSATPSVVTNIDALRLHLEEDPGEDTVVLGPTVDQTAAFRLAEEMRISRPSLGVILVRQPRGQRLLAEALRPGSSEVVERARHRRAAHAVRRSRGSPASCASRGRRRRREDRPRGRIVTVFSAKGGCGKTTLATNLAAALADRGRRDVCLVDLDLAFGDVAIALQLFPAHTIADAVPLGESLDSGALSRCSPRTPPG